MPNRKNGHKQSDLWTPPQARATSVSTKSYTVGPLVTQSVLADTFIPEYKKQVNLAPIRDRWKCDTTWIDKANNDVDYDRYDQDTTIGALAKNFIPAVQCVCNKDTQAPPPHGEGLYMPTLPHKVAPNYQFALRNDSLFQAAQQKIEDNMVDLDETTSISEYTAMFEQALRLEYEEHLRLYELYSLYHVNIIPIDGLAHPPLPSEGNRLVNSKVYKMARIFIDGIADARPTLQIGDIVLLRPIPEYGQVHLEIESRIVRVIRGQTFKHSSPSKDQVIIAWGLNHRQTSHLESNHSLSAHSKIETSGFHIKFNIRFIPSAVPLERCLTALDWLTSVSRRHPLALSDVLFPVKAPEVKPLTPQQVHRMKQDDSEVNKPLNELQSSFVKMVGARTRDPEFNTVRPPMILTGPAGTGKTKTLMVAIADVLGLMPSGCGSDIDTTRNRVLVCAPSHAAADVITHRLQAFLNQTSIFRMYDKSRPTNTVPASIIPFTCRNPATDDFTLPAPHAWKNFRVIVCTCMDAHILFRAKITNEAIAKRRKCFREYLLSDSHNLGFSIDDLPDNSTDPYFSHLFIDESAQASEPEILIPMSCVIDPNPGAKKVEIALIGDPRQLSPLVFSERSEKFGLSRSFMERLLKRPVEALGWGEDHMLGPEKNQDSLFEGGASSLSDLIRYYANIDGQELLTIFLCENYRGHSSFLMMPSSLFYFDRLKCKKELSSKELEFWCSRLRAIEALSTPVQHYPTQQAPPNGFKNALTVDSIGSVIKVHKQKSWPICFMGVKGEDKSVALDSFTSTDSWQNAKEAAVVLEIVTSLVDGGVVTSRIGVMTPFRGQVVLIRQYLRSKNFFDVNVGTIENYQGVEQDVIIFSLTRSNPAFVHHDIKRRMGVFGEVRYKQANVALTRAENLFVMIGNPEPMWNDRLWTQFLMFCFRNGLWYGQALDETDMQVLSSRDRKMISTPQEDRGRETMVTIVSTLEKIQRLN